jgi:hypothetical protein
LIKQEKFTNHTLETAFDICQPSTLLLLALGAVISSRKNKGSWLLEKSILFVKIGGAFQLIINYCLLMILSADDVGYFH